MDSIIITFLIIGTLGLIIVLFMSFSSFNKLVKLEYNQYRQEWIKDGKPQGFYWRPPECTMFSWYAMQRLTILWLFKTPEWVIGTPSAVDTLRKMRRCVLTWNAGVIILIPMAIIYFTS